ncbi:MAG: hypothetical protein ACYTGC_08580 [Planctomycetota bacterium]|jgi:hypothetical protein
MSDRDQTRKPRRTGGAALLGLLVACFGTGCGPTADDANGPMGVSEPELDLGQDWADPPASGGGVGGAAGRERQRWSIILETFSGEGHEQAAATMITELPRVNPRLTAAWVHTSPRGSTVVFGRYAGPDDPAAQRDMQWVKTLTIQDRPVFPRAMLSRLREGVESGLTPFELMSVRQQYPDLDPLYTLQIAVWGSFEGAMPWRDAQRRARAQVQQLRGQGYQAYVHTDPDVELSMVTIGLFDHRALNPRSGLYSPEIESLLRKFEAHLVNGEPVWDPIARRNQPPSLVLVPR